MVSERACSAPSNHLDIIYIYMCTFSYYFIIFFCVGRSGQRNELHSKLCTMHTEVAKFTQITRSAEGTGVTGWRRVWCTPLRKGVIGQMMLWHRFKMVRIVDSSI